MNTKLRKLTKVINKIEVPSSLLDLDVYDKELLITYVSIASRVSKSARKIEVQYKDIQEDTKMSYRTVKRALEVLESRGYITVLDIGSRTKEIELII